mmetsp:Transcript_22784/g.50858  ORF Transcript_22784/g.50858 Transcript_22784/m.50858 type:complete len:548 (-) Transcript_22784:9-1652(-)
MTGLDACLYPTDPEPEYVAINAANSEVLVTLQENNCNVLVDLAAGSITNSYSAGSVSLKNIDLTEDAFISQTEATEEPLLREPDGATWIGETTYFATANEGDLDGGSRGFSIFDSVTGDVIYDSGNTMELEVARIGHYPEERSENKGNEPENVLYAEISGKKFLFVCSERSNVVFVYEVSDPSAPVLCQTLAVSVGPEGLAVIPEMKLLVVASEKDDRGDGIRSSIAIFCLDAGDVPEYPTIVSAPRGLNGDNGPFIAFSALSGLAAASPKGIEALADADPDCLFSIEDSFYTQNRVLTIDASEFPAVITAEKRIMDAQEVLSKCLEGNLGEGVEMSDMVNDDKTVNIDPEGIAVSAKGGFWVASEGRGTVGDEDKPFEYPNLLLKLNDDAEITECILLPTDGSFPDQVRYGFEGVAEDGDNVVIAIQRAWGDESNPRIAVYNTAAKTWKYAFYPLEEPSSQNGGWVGLSDIAPVGDGKFFVIERDNQSGPDASVKTICCIDLADFSFADGVTLEKEGFRDLLPDFTATNGMVPDKIEGLAITSCRL